MKFSELQPGQRARITSVEHPGHSIQGVVDKLSNGELILRYDDETGYIIHETFDKIWHVDLI